ncbi:hypothetical protein AVEN_113636-1 [Araneus ventricosus]|uniref:Uncharacterized protein n=1 Tax=Araneus ventricosus TaxID=182803 RepID=A0A4Y2NL25_ARAVE|nr:hypothetical protein AVEN_113636-1 [Araneus ventricosus]
MSVRKGCDIKELLRQYLSVKSFAESIDNDLSFLVFCETMLTSIVTYFLLIAVSQNGLYSDVVVLAGFCLNSATLFIAMSVAATAVAEASAEYVKLSKSRLNEDESAIPRRKCVAFITSEQEINFTVWKIVPINRSFVLSTIGTIITYVMLFNSMH